MQAVRDLASSAKEKLRKGSAKAEEKAEKSTAQTTKEKQMAHERKEAKEAEAKAAKHYEKADHRSAAADAAHNLQGHHLDGKSTMTSVPLSRDPAQPQPIGATAELAANPSGAAAAPYGSVPGYPASGGRPASQKYL